MLRAHEVGVSKHEERRGGISKLGDLRPRGEV